MTMRVVVKAVDTGNTGTPDPKTFLLTTTSPSLIHHISCIKMAFRNTAIIAGTVLTGVLGMYHPSRAVSSH
jgi:hypothetical protein